jgi:hypothetical protein
MDSHRLPQTAVVEAFVGRFGPDIFHRFLGAFLQRGRHLFAIRTDGGYRDQDEEQ